VLRDNGIPKSKADSLVDVLKVIMMYPISIFDKQDVTKAHVPVPSGARVKENNEVEVDAVLRLNWNRGLRNLLAYASVRIGGRSSLIFDQRL